MCAANENGNSANTANENADAAGNENLNSNPNLNQNSNQNSGDNANANDNTGDPTVPAGVWTGALTSQLLIKYDGVDQPPVDWSPGVSIEFDAAGGLLGVSSIAPNPYFRADRSDQLARLAQVGDQDESCVYSRAASGYEVATLVEYAASAEELTLIFTSTFGGHAGSTSLSNGTARHEFRILRAGAAIHVRLVFESAYDQRELNSDYVFVTKRVEESFSGEADFAAGAALASWEDACP